MESCSDLSLKGWALLFLNFSLEKHIMLDILRTLLLLDKEKWKLGYNLTNFQTLIIMIILMKVLDLQSYYKCNNNF